MLVSRTNFPLEQGSQLGHKRGAGGGAMGGWRGARADGGPGGGVRAARRGAGALEDGRRGGGVRRREGWAAPACGQSAGGGAGGGVRGLRIAGRARREAGGDAAGPGGVRRERRGARRTPAVSLARTCAGTSVGSQAAGRAKRCRRRDRRRRERVWERRASAPRFRSGTPYLRRMQFFHRSILPHSRSFRSVSADAQKMPVQNYFLLGIYMSRLQTESPRASRSTYFGDFLEHFRKKASPPHATANPLWPSARMRRDGWRLREPTRGRQNDRQ